MSKSVRPPHCKIFSLAERVGLPHTIFADELADGSGCGESEGEGWAMGYIKEKEILFHWRAEDNFILGRSREVRTSSLTHISTLLTDIHS